MNYEEALHDAGLCAEIVPYFDEDFGPSGGRCERAIVSKDEPMCLGHLDQFKEWQAMSQVEKAQWEHEVDRW